MASFSFILKSFGFQARTFVNSIKGLPVYIRNRKLLKKQISDNKEFNEISMSPCLSDRYESAGSLPLHYFYQDLYTARQIYIADPVRHVDIGSRVDGFIAHLVIFRTVEVFDIRDIQEEIPGVKFVSADLMDENFPFVDYTDSVSSLHAIEHFGLGRYGDKVDSNGYLKGLENIYRMLKQGGRFYFSVPIGPQRIEFDAHRVFSVRYLLDLFSSRYKLITFSYVDDKNKLHTDAPLTENNISSNFGCNYGCGIFILEKL
jgi:SAM-dependent methyltransferase